MLETAYQLTDTIENKTIVLTGAMIPFKFGSTDGIFNMGSALSYVQVIPSDIYISMNGHTFDWKNIRKNKNKGIFEEWGLENEF